MNDYLRIRKDYLDELITHISRSLCGKTMKRFEISGDTDTTRKQVKELIYEEFRHLKDLLEAHNAGLDDMVQFKFEKSKEKQ